MLKYLDTNILLRYLVDDPQADSIEKMLKEEKELILLDLVVGEVVWTLQTFYKLKKAKIAELVTNLVSLKSIKCNARVVLAALETYRNKNISYTDAYIAASMKAKRASLIYSFDRDFDKIPHIRRIEP